MATIKQKNNNQSAKIVLCVFAFIIILMVLNVIYLGATGKHLVSGANI